MIAPGDRTSSNGCKYNQIGFATPAVDKSLLVAKRKMTIAVFLCVIFMVSCCCLALKLFIPFLLSVLYRNDSTIVKLESYLHLWLFFPLLTFNEIRQISNLMSAREIVVCFSVLFTRTFSRVLLRLEVY